MLYNRNSLCRERPLLSHFIRKDFMEEAIFELLSGKKVYYVQKREDTRKACSAKGAVWVRTWGVCWTRVGDEPQNPGCRGPLSHAREFGLPWSTKREPVKEVW